MRSRAQYGDRGPEARGDAEQDDCEGDVAAGILDGSADPGALGIRMNAQSPKGRKKRYGRAVIRRNDPGYPGEPRRRAGKNRERDEDGSAQTNEAIAPWNRQGCEPGHRGFKGDRLTERSVLPFFVVLRTISANEASTRCKENIERYEALQKYESLPISKSKGGWTSTAATDLYIMNLAHCTSSSPFSFCYLPNIRAAKGRTNACGMCRPIAALTRLGMPVTTTGVPAFIAR